MLNKFAGPVADKVRMNTLRLFGFTGGILALGSDVRPVRGRERPQDGTCGFQVLLLSVVKANVTQSPNDVKNH